MEVWNVLENLQNIFVMYVDDIMVVEDVGDVIVIWYLYIDELVEVFDVDCVGCEVMEVLWMILVICKNVEGDVFFYFSEMNVIIFDGFEMLYLGRLYVFGVFDCWMLCWDYLKCEFNVELNLNVYLYILLWYIGDNDIFDQNYCNEGLVCFVFGIEF